MIPQMLSETQTQSICDRYEASEHGRELLYHEPTTLGYLLRLLDEALYPEAIQFVAHALPRREAVAWVYGCLHRVGAEKFSAASPVALRAAEEWLHEPSEANRRAAGKASDAAGLSTPAGCAAAAVFWSGGSIGPADLPPIQPGATLTARAVSGALRLAAVWDEPENAAEKFQEFIALGREILEHVPTAEREEGTKADVSTVVEVSRKGEPHACECHGGHHHDCTPTATIQKSGR